MSSQTAPSSRFPNRISGGLCSLFRWQAPRPFNNYEVLSFWPFVGGRRSTLAWLPIVGTLRVDNSNGSDSCASCSPALKSPRLELETQVATHTSQDPLRRRMDSSPSVYAVVSDSGWPVTHLQHVLDGFDPYVRQWWQRSVVRRLRKEIIEPLGSAAQP
jgi:hypothetical protein